MRWIGVCEALRGVVLVLHLGLSRGLTADDLGSSIHIIVKGRRTVDEEVLPMCRVNKGGLSH